MTQRRVHRRRRRKSVWGIVQTLLRMPSFRMLLLVIIVLIGVSRLVSKCCSSTEDKTSESTIVYKGGKVHLQNDDNYVEVGKKINWDNVKNADVVRFHVNDIGRLSVVFNDSNDTHLAALEKTAFVPITSLRAAYDETVPIRRVETCREFCLDSLSHSLPYMQADALDTLKALGQAFSDSVEARTGHRYRMIVTSVLRTNGCIKKLRRHNGNAVDNSAHRFGRTIDITYINFVDDGSGVILNQEDLKNTLAEVIYNLQRRGGCYVKYESHQSCFHITIL